MGFDVVAAKKAGYSDAEIADYLGQSLGVDVGSARESGYDDAELVKRLVIQDAGLIDSIGMAVKNVPESAKSLGKATWEAVKHPLDSLDGLASLLRGAINVPSVTTGTSPQDSERWEAFKSLVADRYGSGSAVKNTLVSDPVGAAADVASLLTGVGGAAKAIPSIAGAGSKVAAVGAAIDPMTNALRAASYPVRKAGSWLGGAIDAAPETLMVSGLKPSASLPLDQIDRIASTAVKERILPTRDGLNKLNATQGAVGQEIGSIIDAATQNGGTVNLTDAVTNGLQYMRRRALSGPMPEADLVKIQALEDSILHSGFTAPDGTVVPSRGGVVPLREAQDLKTGTTSRMKDSAFLKENQDNPLQVQGLRDVASSLRQSIEGVAPEVVAVNQRWGSLEALAPVLENALKRTDRANVLPTRSMFGGAAGGPLGYILGGLVDSLPFKGQMAFGADWARNNVLPGARWMYDRIGEGIPIGSALSRWETVGSDNGWGQRPR